MCMNIVLFTCTVGILTISCDRMSDRLTVKNVHDVLRKLSAPDCYRLGIQLDLLPSKLRDLQLRYPAELFKLKVIQTWLESDPHCGWEKLASALEALDMNVLAATVRSRLSGYESDTVTALRSQLREVADALAQTVASVRSTRERFSGTADQMGSGRRLLDMRSGVF